MTTCLITGCAFHDTVRGRWTWGDLYQLKDTYIFNANVKVGEVSDCWWFYTPFAIEAKAILADKIPAPSDYFEKRGVIVLPKVWATLNQLALEYLHNAV